ncbi:N-acetylglucosamine-1-phosphotransferase subunits alpha/beta-like isoform X2 [Clavelina lepadiformis]|uniref:N-acetylglucosamine-1-phosphotransferase subunits alpha/beta-like isoform X2 n=1 Tax=Clavelina lepadiformis TaxID=159417 RepID=UPI0040414E1C
MIKTLVRRRRKTCFLFAIIFVLFQITGQVLKLQSSRQSTKAIKTNRSHKRKSSELYDLVYTWVNGSDPDFKTSLKTTLQQTIGYQTPRISEFQDYDQLKYSLRSVTLHCSWIRNIYIVTNGQVPVWLNTSNTMIQLSATICQLSTPPQLKSIYTKSTASLPTFSTLTMIFCLELRLHLKTSWLQLMSTKFIWPVDFHP